MDIQVDEREFARAGPAQRKRLRTLARQLADDPYVGNRLRRDLIPKRLAGLPNLYRLELPDGWRALCTIVTNPVEGDVVRIVWIGDHQRYDRLLGY